jgi:hypothetical protein
MGGQAENVDILGKDDNSKADRTFDRPKGERKW